MTIIQPTLHLKEVYELLIETYGEPHNQPDMDPLGGLIGTILSQHTSDINSGRAYQKLIKTFPDWERVRDAPTGEIAEAIRSGGLANIKARRIQEVLHEMSAQQEKDQHPGPLTRYLLEKLQTLQPEQAWQYLRTYPGVGPKTAACVLMFNLDQPVIPVDTHVHRTSKRLGLIGEKVSADQAHVIFAKIVPPEWVYPLHVNLIHHGRQICHAQRPDCGRCPLYGECVYVGSVNPQGVNSSVMRN
ncbi:endonuclease III domain-containing protein [Tengunoibacter tsumagoiensis]|uniref:Endonuclease III n=1 Tax=Tengunoibacter tsumagoiensis TaxID=2014871 RepID=A0A402A1T8_9CHLR|nr:endonuclease III [Tengunoibacter tsumagoiensis]GCE13118.1 endonuclease III [Tengunoibacter tsumagoiensis]